MMDSSTMANLAHTIEVIVALADTQLVSSIHIKLIDNGVVIFDDSIPFAVTHSQTGDYTLTRNEKVIYLDFGIHMGAIDLCRSLYRR